MKVVRLEWLGPDGFVVLFCVVCGHGGAGLVELPDGRVVHRWPCRDRMV